MLETFPPQLSQHAPASGRVLRRRQAHAGDAADFRLWLATEKGQAETTISKEIKRAKEFFEAALAKKLPAENPFAKQKCPAQVNNEREYFVTRDEIAKVLDACPNNEWRLLTVMGRFLGLRIPSEIRNMTWDDVNWEQRQITIWSPKKKDSRTCPIFPEVMQFLELQFENAQPGDVYVGLSIRTPQLPLALICPRVLNAGKIGLFPHAGDGIFRQGRTYPLALGQRLPSSARS